MVLSDISNSTIDRKKDPSSAAAEYNNFAGLTGTQHSTATKISTALGSLLIVSILISFISLALCATRKSGFSDTLLIPLFIDSVVLLACCSLAFTLFMLKIFSVSSDYTSDSTALQATVGIGFWLLIAAFMCRLLSNPVLLLSYLILGACAAFLPLICCLAMCCSSNKNNSSSNRALTTYNDDAQYTVELQDTEMAYVEQKSDGVNTTTTMLWMRSRYLTITNL